MTRDSLVKCGLALFAACTSASRIDRQTAGDVDAVRGAVGERIGAEAPPREATPDDGSVDRRVGDLVSGEVDEATAIRVALLNNRAVRASYERLGIARAELVRAGLLANPILAANAKFFDGGTEIEAGLTRSFLDLFFRPLRRRLAGSELAAAKAEVTRDLVALTFDVRRAFVDLRAAERLAESRRRALAAATAAHDLMRRLHEAGNVTDPRRTLEAANEARARLDLAAAEAAVVEAREPLQVLMGLWGGATAWRVAGGLEDRVGEGVSLDGVEAAAIRSSLDLRASRAHVEAAAAQAGLTTWEGLFPALEAGLATKQESDRRSWGLGPDLSLGLPLLDRGSARRAGAAAALRERLAWHVALAVEIRSAARTHRERFRSLRDRAAYARAVYLPLRARLVRETLAEYNALQVGAFEVLIAKRDELDAERDYVETLRRAWNARLDLEEMLAGSLRRPRSDPEPARADAPSARRGEEHGR